MEERKWKVYVHENKYNGKRYVGITSKTLNERWNNGKGYKNNKYLTNSIKKYGWDDGFYHYVIEENLTKSEAEQYEKDFIRLWDLRNRNNGYNMTDGGEGTSGHFVSENNKKIASMTHKGKIISKEHREAISKKVSGNNNPFYGKKHTEETKKLISDMRKNEGNFNGGNNPKAKPVICNGHVYDCAKDCSLEYGINGSTMRSWLRGNRKMPQKFIDMGLRYATEEDISIINELNLIN